MTKKLKTHVLFVIDRSSSMDKTKKQAVDGFNEQINKMKRRNAEDQDLRVSLITFNEDVFEHLWDEPVSALQKANYKDFKPDGMTAFLDALGYGIHKLQETTEPDEDTAYLVVAISDGGENSSRHYVNGSLKEMIEGCQRTGQWTFTYMGCNASVLEDVARRTSIPVSNMAAWSNAEGAAATRGMTQVGDKMADYFYKRKAKAKVDLNFYSQSADKAADYMEVEEKEIAFSPEPVKEDKPKEAPKPYVFGEIKDNLPKYEYEPLKGKGIFEAGCSVKFVGPDVYDQSTVDHSVRAKGGYMSTSDMSSFGKK